MLPQDTTATGALGTSILSATDTGAPGTGTAVPPSGQGIAAAPADVPQRDLGGAFVIAMLAAFALGVALPTNGRAGKGG